MHLNNRLFRHNNRLTAPSKLRFDETTTASDSEATECKWEDYIELFKKHLNMILWHSGLMLGAHQLSNRCTNHNVLTLVIMGTLPKSILLNGGGGGKEGKKNFLGKILILILIKFHG